MILTAGLAFMVFFSALTLYVIANDGIDPTTVLALVILTMIGIGVIGAIRNPPEA